MSKSLQALQDEFDDSMRTIRAMTAKPQQSRDDMDRQFREMFGDGNLPDFTQDLAKEIRRGDTKE